MVERLPSPSLPLLFFPLLLSSLVFLSRAEDGRNSSAASLNSTTALVQNPTVALSLSLGLSQELNPNPFINPRPTLSLSLSLSVSEEIKANPFDFINLPPPLQQDERQQGQRVDEQPDIISQAKTRSRVGRGKCTYSVSIKTSCSSPRATRDAVSLDFGDAARNEVYAARLDDPASGTFDRCSVDTFRLVGPCSSRPCFLYLRRSGRDGWTPEQVKVFYQTGDTRAVVTFGYNAPLPDGVWYGFNLCHDAATTKAGDNSAAAVLPKAAVIHPTRASEADGDKVEVKSNKSPYDDDDDDDDDDGGDPTIKVKTKVSGTVKTIIFKI